MISFRDYLTEPPKIFCGIPHQKESTTLLEELHAEPFYFFIPPNRRSEYVGKSVYPGVLHVQQFGKPDRYLVHRGEDREPIEFKNFRAAKIHADQQIEEYKNNLGKIHDSLMNHYHQTHNKYEPHLKAYGKGSSNLNLSLLSGNVPEQALRLDHVMNHRTTPDDLVVYSGISSNHAQKVLTNDVVSHPSFLSTSLNLQTAFGFSVSQGTNHVLKIHVPAGHPGAYVGDLSDFKHEQEFLLPRGLKLRFHRDKEAVFRNKDMDIHVHHTSIES